MTTAQETQQTTQLATASPSALSLGQVTIRLAAGAMSLVKLTSTGLVRSIVTNVKLDRKEHVYSLRGRNCITAAGFNFVNRVLGVTFFQPEMVRGEDGASHGNPLVAYDDAGAATRVVIRCIGIWRNAVGNTVAIDSTLIYDMVAVFAQDALAKWHWKGNEHNAPVTKDWGELFSTENVPDDVRTDPHKKCIPTPGGYTLAVKLEGEVIDLVSEHATRVRFASRNADTVNKRNILKKFLGVDAVGEDRMICVTSWVQADKDDFQAIADMVERAESGVFVIDKEEVTVERQTQIVDDIEQESVALGDEHDEEAPRRDDAPADAGVAPVAAMPRTDPKVADRRAKIRTLRAKLPEEVADGAIVRAGLEGMEEVGHTGDLGLLDAAIKELSDAAPADHTTKGTR